MPLYTGKHSLEGKQLQWIIIALVVGIACILYGCTTLWKQWPTARSYMPFIGIFVREPAEPTPTPEEPSPPPMPTGNDLITLVQQYNQADTIANRNNDLAILLPYIHPHGPLYANLAAQYRARIAAGTYRHVQLTRFWAEQPVIEESRAQVRTREIWDVTVIDANTQQATSSSTGIITVQVYTIIPDVAGTWRIWDITTIVENQP